MVGGSVGVPDFGPGKVGFQSLPWAAEGFGVGGRGPALQACRAALASGSLPWCFSLLGE